HRNQDQVAGHMQRANRVSEDERREDIERRLLRHAQQSRKDDLSWLSLDDFEDRGFLDLVGIQQLLEYGRLEDAEADPKADTDKNDRKPERKPPAPDGELIARPGAEPQDRQVRQEQAARHAELRP